LIINTYCRYWRKNIKYKQREKLIFENLLIKEKYMERVNLSCGHTGWDDKLNESLKKSLAKIDLNDLAEYSDPEGSFELRRRIAEFLGGGADPRNIIITASSQSALFLVFNYLYEKRFTTFVKDPCYFGVHRLWRGPVKGYAAAEDLAGRHINQADAIIYCNSNFHNPSGLSLSGREKNFFSALAEAKDAVIIEDNPYDLLYYDGSDAPGRIYDLIPDRTIYIGSLSKVICPGLRLGFIMAGPDSIKKLRSRKISYDLFTSTLSQKAALGILDASYLEYRRNDFKKKRDSALNLLEQHFGKLPGITWTRPAGGIFLELRLPPAADMAGFIRAAAAQGVILDDDCHTYLDKKNHHTIRLNFTGQEKILRSALGVMAEILTGVLNN